MIHVLITMVCSVLCGGGASAHFVAPPQTPETSPFMFVCIQPPRAPEAILAEEEMKRILAMLKFARDESEPT